jgi:RHS repeat-associated protein
VGGHYEVQGSTTRKYYYLGAQRVAMLENSTVYYVLGDHLGSTSLIVNSTGGLYGENRYKAFGETRYTSGTIPTTFGFTGQRQESGLGLYFYNARWYDPVLGRFVQADTVVPQLYDPQALNRFSYSYNDPLKYIDPTGHDPWYREEPYWVDTPWSEAINSLNDAFQRARDNTCQWQGLPGTLCAPPGVQYDPEYVLSEIQAQTSASTSVVLMAANSQNSEDENKNGGGSGGGLPGGGDPSLLDKIKSALKAQKLSGSPGSKSIATTESGSPKTLSGWTARPGYSQATRQSFELAEEIGYQFESHPYDQGVPGRFYASHAEPQAAALAPNQPLGTNNAMCSSCQNFFSRLAQSRGVTQVVADPYNVHVFSPGGERFFLRVGLMFE